MTGQTTQRNPPPRAAPPTVAGARAPAPRHTPQTVAGVCAPAPRLTPLGAAGLALMVALPGGAVLALLDWLVF